MSDMQTLLIDSATRIFEDLSTPEVRNASEKGEWQAVIWQALEETGLTLASIPETSGGSGADLDDGLMLIRLVGRYAAPIPLADTFLASQALVDAGLSSESGSYGFSMATGLTVESTTAGLTLNGEISAVPFARHVNRLVLVIDVAGSVQVVSLERNQFSVIESNSMAGEPEDRVILEGAVVDQKSYGTSERSLNDYRALAALTRALMMVGALESCLDLAAMYSTERVQFGRSLNKFQAIQQDLAFTAGEVVAARVACETAVEQLVLDIDAEMAIAAAKIRAGEAADLVTKIAHQIHGAIGFTHEHSLQHFTRRLWAWRDQYGNEAEWSVNLGDALKAKGGDSVWSFVTMT